MTVHPSNLSLRHAVLGVGLLGTSVLAASSPVPAHAALSRCSSDPIVWLSNATKVDLTATLSVDRREVKQITYVLHVPAGVQVTRIVYTAGELGHKESVAVVDDATGPYMANSVAESYSSGGTVEVTMSVLDQSNSIKGSDHATGQMAQPLLTQVALQ